MKKIILIGLILAAVGIGIGLMMYNKPHENIKNAKADHKVEATAIFNEFVSDEAGANEKYLNKTVEVNGTVSDVSKDDKGNVSVTLASGDPLFGVKCNLDPFSKHKRTEFQNGEKVTLKGLCSGYLSDVVIDRCVEYE